MYLDHRAGHFVREVSLLAEKAVAKSEVGDQCQGEKRAIARQIRRFDAFWVAPAAPHYGRIQTERGRPCGGAFWWGERLPG